MDTPGNRSTRWTQTNASRRPDRNNGLVTFEVRTLYNKSTRHQIGAQECLLHGADSPPIKAPDIPQTASKVSQSQICRPIDKVGTSASSSIASDAAGLRQSDGDVASAAALAS